MNLRTPVEQRSNQSLLGCPGRVHMARNGAAALDDGERTGAGLAAAGRRLQDLSPESEPTETPPTQL